MFTANNPPHRPSSRSSHYGASRHSSHLFNSIRTRTPNMSDDGAMSSASGQNAGEGVDITGEEDDRTLQFREQYKKTEKRLMEYLDGTFDFSRIGAPNADASAQPASARDADANAGPASAPKKPARKIDEDDYGDDDEDDEDEDMTHTSPLKSRSTPNGITAGSSHGSSSKSGLLAKSSFDASKTEPPKSNEEIRRKLEQDKKAAEDAARRSNFNTFYTYETDRDALMEQQKLDELDRQVEAETGNNSNQKNGPAPTTQQGTLSSTNLGGSINLTLKHLLTRIDAQRVKIQASDAQLRSLLSEVRKNRSKWANEDKIGQEELYESIEKVMMELKAMTEYAHPFLQKVNKREAPDYHQIITKPMDIGTMLKKLKGLAYKSKKEFVDDLMLIWSNCLKYNNDLAHPLRKKALHMQKESELLIPLIPDIVIRDRAEVEAEERRLHRGTETAEPDDSEDEEPIMASRGRKAPSKSSKGTSNNRKAPPGGNDSTPKPDSKPSIPTISSATSNLKNEFLRADSDAPGDVTVNGFNTPPPGTLTPLRPNGLLGTNAPGSQADPSELDDASNAPGAGLGTAEDADLDDLEYKTWKLLTKKDRARVAAQRHRLFRGDTLDVDQPALLRSKAGMRKLLRRMKDAEEQSPEAETGIVDGNDGVTTAAVETLADGIEEHERDLPDYYNPVESIPDIKRRLRWVEDSEGQVVEQSAEYLRMIPEGTFKAPSSHLSRKIDENMKQMQETRKIVAKIGIVKQMQIQSQIYQNQFQKYDPAPFVEQDVDRVVVSEDGPVMCATTCRAALQRSVGKIFYHAGFEDFQPTALEAITDIASSTFANLAKTLNVYGEYPKVKDESATDKPVYKQRFTPEESILHTLQETAGLEIEELESYCKEDVERMSTKLVGIHDRMKTFLADLLRPALDHNVGTDGVGAFNDGSEQFVGGDFAEDLGEDFFGFRELGLDQEFGLTQLSVPLHLLQNRMHSAYSAQNASTVSTGGNILDEPPVFDPATVDSIKAEIGLIHNFFLRKLQDMGDQPLVEDDNLPVKQRFPKPRLPPNGKISSPRKRPIREQQQLARKKRKLEESKDDGNAGGPVKPPVKPIGKLKLEMPANKESMGDPEKDDASAVGMMSPESIAA